MTKIAKRKNVNTLGKLKGEKGKFLEFFLLKYSEGNIKCVKENKYQIDNGDLRY